MKNNKDKHKCYRCESPATSSEHAPPKSFFPEDHRSQLITVPSCDRHNLRTSHDDEYVRNILVTFAGCNELAADCLSDKAKRSFNRSPKLLHRTFKNVLWTEYEGQKTAAFEMDFDRVERTMQKIAAALNYHHFSEKVTWDSTPMIKQLVGPDLKGGDLDHLFSMLDRENLDWHGTNPRAFKYRFIRFEGIPTTFHFVFYEGVDIIVAPVM